MTPKTSSLLPATAVHHELPALTGLRFVAALSVLLFHLYKRSLLPALPLPLSNIVSQGALGVNLFFVLSGLLLTYSYLPATAESRWPTAPDYRRFLLKRLARIYPVYVAAWAVAALGSLWLKALPPDFGWLLTLNLTLTQAWVPPLAMEWFGGGAWSVAVELFFYLLFPLVLPRLGRLGQRQLLGLLAMLWLLSCGPGLFFAKFPALPLFRWVYAFPPARLPEFVSGMVAGLLVFRCGRRVPGWAVLGSWALALLYLSRLGPHFEGYVAHNIVVLPALVLTVMHLATSPVRLLAGRAATYFGRLSYGFYLWQLVILLLLDVLWTRHLFDRHAPLAGWVALALILVCSVASYHLLEVPARRVLLRRLQPPRG